MSRRSLPVAVFATGDVSCENMGVATGAKSKVSERSGLKTERSSKPSSTGTRRTASVAKKSSSRRRSTAEAKAFVICVKNEGYRASLELRKLYERLPDRFALANGLVRVVDESGEDYLYAADFFISVSFPKSIESKLRRIGRKPAA